MLSENWVNSTGLYAIVKFNITFKDGEYLGLYKLGKYYLNLLTYKLYTFSKQNLQTFDITHVSKTNRRNIDYQKMGKFVGPP